MKYLIEYYCNTDIGLSRKENQDSFVCIDKKYNDVALNGCFWTDNQILGVFDGMGGEQCGREASQIASDTAIDFKFKGDIAEKLKDFCLLANNRICKYADDHNVKSMGTTAAMLCFSKKRIFLCNIGDSRIYRISENKIEQISFDHVVSYGTYRRKPPLSQNLGIPEEEMVIQPYIDVAEYRVGDYFLICSDGLTDMLDEKKIKEIIQNNECNIAGNILIEEAKRNGGRDNITVILCNVLRKKII